MIQQLHQLSQDGGWVFYPLLSCAFLLWWFLGARAAAIWIPKGAPSAVLEQPSRFSILGSFTQKAFSFRHRRKDLDIEFRLFRSEVFKHRSIIQALIAVAPLLGLLGTVTGMMETFRGLGEVCALLSNRWCCRWCCPSLTDNPNWIDYCGSGYHCLSICRRASQKGHTARG